MDADPCAYVLLEEKCQEYFSFILPACAQLLSHRAAAEARCRAQPSPCVHLLAPLLALRCAVLPALRSGGCDLISIALSALKWHLQLPESTPGATELRARKLLRSRVFSQEGREVSALTLH